MGCGIRGKVIMLGYGQDTGRHSRAFLVQLDSVADVDWPLAEEAASATFDSFLEGFSQVEVARVQDRSRV
jgi:heme oxygenase